MKKSLKKHLSVPVLEGPGVPFIPMGFFLTRIYPSDKSMATSDSCSASGRHRLSTRGRPQKLIRTEV
jgi:hypothetical protein